MDLSASNQHAYTSPDAVAFYAGFDEITPAEAVIFTTYAEEIGRANLLDLGVGGGRTTQLLASVALDYTGIDYVPALVEAARRRCPGADLRVGDARDLGEFGNDEFDMVLFSFNGLDYVSHADREVVLGEIRRVLRPGGLFVFSTHNLHKARPVRLPSPGRPRLQRRWLGKLRRWPTLLARHLRMRRQEQRGDGWAVLNDEAHDYQLLTHYTTRAAQEQQLLHHGFTPVSCYAADGEEAPTIDTRSYSLYFVAR